MKFRVVIDVDVSTTIAETMQRNGFAVCVDGSALQIKVANCPAIPKRKTKIKIPNNPPKMDNTQSQSTVQRFTSSRIPKLK